MTEYIIHRSSERPLKFKGEILGMAEESMNNAHPDYSGRVGRAAGTSTPAGRANKTPSKPRSARASRKL